jgi:hypothetical protein
MKFKQIYDKVKSKGRDIVVTYGGRFQPFHSNHMTAYKKLKDQFKGSDSFITTSNKVEKKKSPLTFKEKQQIITKMFSVKSKEVVQVKNNYGPKEILDTYPDDTVWIVGVGEKDAQRLSKSKYFDDFTKVDTDDLKGWKDGGYYYIIPMQLDKYNGEMISGTTVREIMGGTDIKEKESLFKHLYKKMDKDIFKLLTDKLGSLDESFDMIFDGTILEDIK